MIAPITNRINQNWLNEDWEIKERERLSEDEIEKMEPWLNPDTSKTTERWLNEDWETEESLKNPLMRSAALYIFQDSISDIFSGIILYPIDNYLFGNHIPFTVCLLYGAVKLVADAMIRSIIFVTAKIIGPRGIYEKAWMSQQTSLLGRFRVCSWRVIKGVERVPQVIDKECYSRLLGIRTAKELKEHPVSIRNRYPTELFRDIILAQVFETALFLTTSFVACLVVNLTGYAVVSVDVTGLIAFAHFLGNCKMKAELISKKSQDEDEDLKRLEVCRYLESYANAVFGLEVPPQNLSNEEAEEKDIETVEESNEAQVVEINELEEEDVIEEIEIEDLYDIVMVELGEKQAEAVK